MPSRRVLKLTFEFHVEEGLNANIRSARIDAATEKMIGAIEGMAPEVFPWAKELVVQREWAYRWLEKEPWKKKFPGTDKNTAPKPKTEDSTDPGADN